MLKREILYVAVLLLGLTPGCKKSNSVNTTADDQFPNKIGDTWHYLVKDTTIHGGQNSSSTQYNVDVVIVNTVKLSNGFTAAIWQFTYPDHIDSNYVYQSGDTIKILDHTGQYLISQYIFPFTSGSSWQYVQGIGYVTVTGPGAITVSNNSFTNAWHIYGSAGLPDAMIAIDEFFEDHVGFVKKYINTSGELILIRHNLDWSLVSYELK